MVVVTDNSNSNQNVADTMMMTGLVTCDDDDDDEWLCQRWSVAWETQWWKAIGDLLKYVIVFISKNHNQIHCIG